MIGTVIAGTNNFFSVECQDGVLRSCSIKGKKIKTEKEFYNPLAPGDSVEIEEDSLSDDKGQILSLLERKNVFLRWNVKGQKPQLLAANLDYLILVTTPAEPPFRPRFIDRCLIQAEEQKIEPVILINKFDLPESGDPDFVQRVQEWERLGYSIHKVSAKTGEGLMELAEVLADKRSAFVGQSGVGKSSLINRLNNDVILKTGSLSKKYGRGAHTTTKGSLLHININEAFTGGLKGMKAQIIDTPGIRRFMLNEISAENVALYFREFKPLLGQCKFGASCSHTTEPGCKILEAVYSGLISEDRYESFRNITEEIKTGTWRD
ncbi:MAG: ribosome small subunit-dependent GTPase A [Treponema sp.]|nr:ribosome small subunit-dependent GTPase A [Treponema sp.]